MAINQSTFIFEVKLVNAKRIKRIIELPARFTLEKLAYGITTAYDFDFKRDYGFYDRTNWKRATKAYELWSDKDGNRRALGIQGVRQTKLTSLWQEVGSCWYFLYHYGTQCLFMVTLNDTGVKKALNYPLVLEKKGEAPKQYPDWEKEYYTEEAL